MKKKDITAETLFTVNYEGIASLYNYGSDSVLISSNAEPDFSFRDYDSANDMDGVDFESLSEAEIARIFEYFDFEKETI